MSAIYYKGKKYTGPTLDLGSGSLTTENKTIVGAINELNSSIPDGSSFIPVYSSNLNVFDTTYPKVSIYYTDGNSLNTPYKAGLTEGQKGICLSFSVDGYWTQIFAPYADDRTYQRYGTPPSWISDWQVLTSITYGTSDLTAGSSALATGRIYLVYE